MLTDAELAAIRDRRAKISKGRRIIITERESYQVRIVDNNHVLQFSAYTSHANAAFIASAPADIDRLLAEVDELHSLLADVIKDFEAIHKVAYSEQKIAEAVADAITRAAIRYPHVIEDQMDTQEDNQ